MFIFVNYMNVTDIRLARFFLSGLFHIKLTKFYAVMQKARLKQSKGPPFIIKRKYDKRLLIQCGGSGSTWDGFLPFCQIRIRTFFPRIWWFNIKKRIPLTLLTVTRTGKKLSVIKIWPLKFWIFDLDLAPDSNQNKKRYPIFRVSLPVARSSASGIFNKNWYSVNSSALKNV